jgi:uncharacterized protein with PQ loop repeat
MVAEKKILPQIATMMGMMSLLPQIRDLMKLKDFDKYSIETAFMSTSSGLLWLIYDLSRGASWLVLTGLVIGLAIQVYILYGILSSRGMKVPSASPKKSTDVLSGYTI